MSEYVIEWVMGKLVNNISWPFIEVLFAVLLYLSSIALTLSWNSSHADFLLSISVNGSSLYLLPHTSWPIKLTPNIESTEFTIDNTWLNELESERVYTWLKEWVNTIDEISSFDEKRNNWDGHTKTPASRSINAADSWSSYQLTPVGLCWRLWWARVASRESCRIWNTWAIPETWFLEESSSDLVMGMRNLLIFPRPRDRLDWISYQSSFGNVPAAYRGVMIQVQA